MPPTPQGTVAPQARPLSCLTREELGREFALRARAALWEWRRQSGRGTRGWWRHPMVELVLDEYARRHFDAAADIERELRLLELG